MEKRSKYFGKDKYFMIFSILSFNMAAPACLHMIGCHSLCLSVMGGSVARHQNKLSKSVEGIFTRKK